jgi:hypothetical protein
LVFRQKDGNSISLQCASWYKNVRGVFVDIVIPGQGGQSNMYLRMSYTLSVAFEGGLPVIETLEEIAAKVADTLAHFKADF